MQHIWKNQARMEHMNSLQVNTTCYYDTIWYKIYIYANICKYLCHIYIYVYSKWIWWNLDIRQCVYMNRGRIHRILFIQFNCAGGKKRIHRILPRPPPLFSGFFPFPSTPGLGGTLVPLGTPKHWLVESLYIINIYKVNAKVLATGKRK